MPDGQLGNGTTTDRSVPVKVGENWQPHTDACGLGAAPLNFFQKTAFQWRRCVPTRNSTAPCQLADSRSAES